MEPAPELCALLQQYYAASARGDTNFLAQIVARNDGVVVVGTDAAEWWQGGDEIIRTWSAAWQSRGGLLVYDSAPEAFRSGSTGWAADQARWRLPDGRSVPFRLTAVFQATGNTWQIVQAHFSVGVPNEALGAAADNDTMTR